MLRDLSVEGTPLAVGAGGSLLGGRYALTEQIGRGGMGVVYRAIDTSLQREVAIKVARHVATDESENVRLRREARTAAVLSHPNTVRIHDADVDVDGRPFLVMELVRGHSVNLQERPMPASTAAWIGTEVCAALGEAHRLGIVHRDLKPQNLMIESDGAIERVRVLDFGIARFVRDGETITRDGVFVGTARYTSPEQAEGLEVGAASDIYSLGVVLYELLSGRPPFDAGTDAAILYLHVHKRPVSLAKVAPGIPRGLSRVVDRCLRKSPADRPRSATELGALLEPFAIRPRRADNHRVNGQLDQLHRADAVKTEPRTTLASQGDMAGGPTREERRRRATPSRRFIASSAIALTALAALIGAGWAAAERRSAGDELRSTVERAPEISLTVRSDSGVVSVDPVLARWRLGGEILSRVQGVAASARVLATSRSIERVELVAQPRSRREPPDVMVEVAENEANPIGAQDTRAELRGELSSLRERTVGDPSRDGLRRELLRMGAKVE